MNSERYLERLRREFPDLKLVDKADSRLCRAIDLLLRGVTLGGMRWFQERYVTTIGCTIYLPANWAGLSDGQQYVVLRHEAVHLRQFRRLGLPLMALLYLLPPLGPSPGRAWLELEAYRETARATAELHGPESVASESFRSFVLRQFTGPAYGWMWPFPAQVRGWLDRMRTEAEAGDL